MTTRAYLVSWLGKGNIIWTPLTETASGAFSIDPNFFGPARYALQVAAERSEIVQQVQKIFDPSMALLGNIRDVVTLSAGLSALSVGLQVANLTMTYRILGAVQRIDERVKEINGKFELHFLDRSLDFFMQCHEGSIGLVPAAAAALEEDCYNALQELMNNKSLRVPAYLRVKLESQAFAIEACNRLMYSILHNGALPIISEDRLDQWVMEVKSMTRNLPVGIYAPQEEVLKAWGRRLSSDPKWSPDPKDDSLLAKSVDRKQFERTRPVVLLARELQMAQTYLGNLEDRLTALPTKALQIKAA
jgi:hypothetical protein